MTDVSDVDASDRAKPVCCVWQRFKPDFDMFAGKPVVVCECGWDWDATDGADTLADAVNACAQHVEREHT